MSSGPIIQDLLRIVLRYQRLKTEGKDPIILKQLADEAEPKIERLWRQLAAFAALKSPDWRSDAQNPGYVEIPLSEEPGNVICVPFHLIPARPELPVLQEIASIAARISLGSVGDRKATICLSGSTLILKDVLKIGDIDFCEYIPNEVPTTALAEAIETQVRQNDLRQCAVSVRMRTGGGGNDELSFYSVTPQAAFTPEQLEKLRELLTRAKNGQTFHLINTTFGGVTEATNWLILFQTPLEGDPVSGLSFAHQEASLGIFGRRRLHAIEALAAYMSFLRAEIGTYATTNPVKAFKRAVSWLRMFGNSELLAELKELVERHRATEAASTLSKLEIWEKYHRMQNLNAPLQQLVEDLKVEIDASVRDLVGQPADPVSALKQLIFQFGAESYISGPMAMPRSPLWERILSLAEQ